MYEDPLPPLPPMPWTLWDRLSAIWCAFAFLFLITLWVVTAFDLEATWLKVVGL